MDLLPGRTNIHTQKSDSRVIVEEQSVSPGHDTSVFTKRTCGRIWTETRDLHIDHSCVIGDFLVALPDKVPPWLEPWYNGRGQKRYSHLSAFRAAGELHSRYYAAARKIVVNVKNMTPCELAAELVGLERIWEQLTGELQRHVEKLMEAVGKRRLLNMETKKWTMISSGGESDYFFYSDTYRCSKHHVWWTRCWFMVRRNDSCVGNNWITYSRHIPP